MSDSEFAQYAFGGQGVKGERSSPCKQPVRVSELSAEGWQRTCLPYEAFVKSFWDLWRKKLGAKATFFLQNLSQLRLQMLRNFPDSTLVSDKGKFKPNGLEAG